VLGLSVLLTVLPLVACMGGPQGGGPGY